MEHVLRTRVAAPCPGWIVGGVDQPIVFLCPAWVKTRPDDAIFIHVKVEDANVGSAVFPIGIVGVTDISAICGEALCVVTIGPVADMRIVSETPDAKVPARDGKYDLLRVERKGESECQ